MTDIKNIASQLNYPDAAPSFVDKKCVTHQLLQHMPKYKCTELPERLSDKSFWPPKNKEHLCCYFCRFLILLYH